MSDRPLAARAATPAPETSAAGRGPKTTPEAATPDAAPGAPIRASSLLALQRAAGNRAVGGLLQRGGATGPGNGRGPVVQRLIAPEQADRVAHQLLAAMDRWGTDEDAIYGALSGRSKADLDAIVAAYQPIAMHGNLDADLRDELNDDELARVRSLMATAAAETTLDPEQRAALRVTRATDIARQLDEAMRGLGTDEEQLLNALTGRSPYEIVEISRAYNDLTGNDFATELRDELSGDDLATALGSYRTMWAEGAGPNPEIGLLQQALNATGATPAVRITAMFGPETTTALRAFQAANPPLNSTGDLNVETWLKLDAVAPRVFRNGRMVIEGPAPAQPRGVSLSGSIHPTLRLNNRGAGVEELQQKLLTLPTTQVPSRPTANGRFDATTRRAVREFQGSVTPPLPQTGVANAATWAALDAVAGPVTVGREEFDSWERVEGSQYGGPTKFTWRIHPDRLEVTVNIRFTGAPNHPMVATWRQQQQNTWNVFKLVDDDHPGTELPLRFVSGNASPADATVHVTVTPPGGTPGRSNAGDYHTGDTDPGLAPHEFGHLIGLQDEYNTGPEQYTIITGEQPFTGQSNAPTDASGQPVAPATIAAEIRTAVTSSPANQRGTKAQAIVATKYSLAQGAFSARVAQAYEQANAGSMIREDNGPSGPVIVNETPGSIANDIAARIPGRNAPETDATAPFLYSNRSLMGEMQSLNTPINAHDHPIAERHVRHFVEIVGRNRPGAWRVVRL